MKIIFKTIIFVMLLSSSLILQLSAAISNEAMIADVVRVLNDVESNKTKKDQESKSFFIKDSKLHTAFRCAFGLSVLCLNAACCYVMNQSRVALAGGSLTDSKRQDNLLSIATGAVALFFMNTAFADFYFSEINRQEQQKKNNK